MTSASARVLTHTRTHAHTLSLSQGQYFVVVDGFDGSTGTFTLSLTCPVTCGSRITGSTLLSSKSYDVPGIPNGNDVAFTLVVPSSTVVSLSTCSPGTTFDTILVILDSSQVDLKINDDTLDACAFGSLQSSLSLTVPAVSAKGILCVPPKPNHNNTKNLRV